MRILHATQPTEAGVARVVAELAADQVRRGWTVTVACPARPPLVGWIEAAGAEHAPWRALRPPAPATVRETRALGAIVRAAEPDIVHLHSSKAGLAGRLAIRGRIPTVFQPHAWSFDAAEALQRVAALRWERFAARWSRAIVCVSAAERDRGRSHGIAGRFAVIPNGIDASSFDPSAEARRAARDRLGVGEEPLAVCVGRLTRQKGQDRLVALWPAVRRRVPAAELVLVGDGPGKDSLERAAGAGVRLVGHRTDVADWLAAADVVAAPSRWEGMSLVVLEAMAAGRSVVATDVPGMQELLGDGAGEVIPAEEPAAFARALADRLEDPGPRREEGRAGRRRVEREHALTTTADRVASLYMELLAR